MKPKSETMWMAWHTGEECFNPEIYGTTKKEYTENLNRVTENWFRDNYIPVKVQITETQPKKRGNESNNGTN